MPVVPEAPTIGPGIPSTSSLTQIRDAIRFLQAKPIAQLRQTTLQILTTATYTPIQFQSEAFDLDPDGVGGHDNVTNNTRYVARYPGYYIVSGMVTYEANATGARHAGWRVNGIDVTGSYVSVFPFAADVNGVAPNVMRVFLDIGHYVELIGYQTSGANRNTFVANTAYQSGMAVGWDRIQ